MINDHHSKLYYFMFINQFIDFFPTIFQLINYQVFQHITYIIAKIINDN